MPVASTASSYIYEGAWINWSRGRVLGLTLTLNPSMATTVSAALAIYISIAGTQLWNLFRYALHQTRATPSKRSLYYHQQQVVLRNTGSDLNTLWQILRLALAWRHQSEAKSIRKSLPLLAWAFLHFVLIVLAGLFSSWLLNVNDSHVLSRSPWCGTFTSSYANETEYLTSLQLDLQQQNYIDSQYASAQQRVDLCDLSEEDCYSSNTSPFHWNSQIVPDTCPFDPSVCHPDINGSLSFDTGYLSSHSDFGLNARKKDRISFRMTALCAPLDDSKYSTDWHSTTNEDGQLVADVTLGYTYVEGNDSSVSSDSNITYRITQPDMKKAQLVFSQSYGLSAQFSQPGIYSDAEVVTFNATRAIRLPTADTSLVMLSFSSSYLEPVDDPWFSAHQVLHYNDDLGDPQIAYNRDLPLTTIGCTQQYQFCNIEASKSSSLSAAPDQTHCTPQYGQWQMTEYLTTNTTSVSALFSPTQNATATRILTASTDSLFYSAIQNLAKVTAPPLKARNLVTDTLSLSLPSTQWITETKYWWSIILMSVQQTALSYSTGQFAADTAYIQLAKPNASDATQQAMYDLCQNQMILMNSWTNYNLFALILTLLLATTIIILGLSIEDITGYIRQRRLRYTGLHGGKGSKQDMWIANGDLEMLRTIDEGRNGTVWTRSKTGIPIANHQCGFVSVHGLVGEGVRVEKGLGVVFGAKTTAGGMGGRTASSQSSSDTELDQMNSWSKGMKSARETIREVDEADPVIVASAAAAAVVAATDDAELPRPTTITQAGPNENSERDNEVDIDNFVNTYKAPFMASFQDRIWLQFGSGDQS